MFSLMNEINVYILHTSFVNDNYSFIVSHIDKSRIEKANRFVSKKDQLLSLGGGYLLYKFLPHKEIKFTDNGKPYMENGPYFNLSHSGEYVVLAISIDRDVGVDIERIDQSKIEAIKYTLVDEEKEINDINDLFLLWSNKESLIKCFSNSLMDIRKIKGLPLEGNRYGGYTKSMLYDGYSLSLTLKEEKPFNINIKKINSLGD